MRKLKRVTDASWQAAVCGALIIFLGCVGAPKKTVSPSPNPSSSSSPRPQKNIYENRAYNAFLEGDLPKAAELYKKEFAAARKSDNQRAAARTLSNIGRIYFELDELDSATLYLAKSHEEFVWAADTGSASKAAAFLAFCHAARGDAKLSGKWFTAASAYKNRDNEHYNAVIKARIDLMLKAKISDGAAVENAAVFYKSKKDLSSLTTVNILKAQAEAYKGNCAEANRLLLEALGYIDKTGEIYRRAAILLNLASISSCAQNNDEAMRYYERAADCAPKGVVIPSLSDISACNWSECKP